MRFGFAILITSTMLASPAMALTEPHGSVQDPRAQVVPYTDDIVALHGTVGHTLAIEFSKDENLPDTWLSDSADLQAELSGNLLLLKPKRPMAAQPIVGYTRRGDGTRRRYLFQFEAVEDTTDSRPYAVRFTYPDDSKAEALARWRAAQAARSAQEAAKKLAEKPVAVRNVRYVGVGDWRLLPSREVWDDGNSTYLRYPGNARMPSLFVIGADGKESVAPYSVDGGTVTIHGVYRGIRLRDGDAAFCIWNQAFDAIGANPSTGTTSPDVQREIKAPRP